MPAAIAVVLLGALMTGLGVIETAMYDVGIVTIFIGLVGVVVRLTEWATALVRARRGD